MKDTTCYLLSNDFDFNYPNILIHIGIILILYLINFLNTINENNLY